MSGVAASRLNGDDDQCVTWAFERWEDDARDQHDGETPPALGEKVIQSENREAQRSAAPPPAAAVENLPVYGAPANRLGGRSNSLHMSPGETANGHHDNYPRYAVGLVFVEDKTLGFPRVFVRDVLPGSAAQHSSRLKRGDLLVLVDNEDVYGYDLDHIATILPGRQDTYVRLGFANVDRSFIEIDLQRNCPIRPHSNALPHPTLSNNYAFSESYALPHGTFGGSQRSSPVALLRKSNTNLFVAAGPDADVQALAEMYTPRTNSSPQRARQMTTPREAPPHLQYGQPDFEHVASHTHSTFSPQHTPMRASYSQNPLDYHRVPKDKDPLEYMMHDVQAQMHMHGSPQMETHTSSNMVSPGTEANMFGQLNAQLSNMYGHTNTPNGLPQQDWQMPQPLLGRMPNVSPPNYTNPNYSNAPYNNPGRVSFRSMLA